MGTSEFYRTLWHGLIQSAFEEKMVFKGLANTAYEGNVGYGESVRFMDMANFTTSTYTGATITYSEADLAALTMTVNGSEYVAKKIDDIGGIQKNPQILAKFTAKIGESLAEKVDTAFANLYGQCGINGGSYSIGTTGSPIAITTTNLISTLSIIHRALNEANAPQQGRFLVCPPWLIEKIRMANIIRDTNNSAIIRAAGFIGNFLGFDIYMSNSIVTGGSTYYYIMAGIQGESFGFAGKISEVEMIRSELTFSDNMRALAVYGVKVLRPSATAVLIASEGSETTI